MKYLSYILILIIGVSCSGNQNEQESVNIPENVILLIGDGMGLSQLSSVFYYKKDAVNIARFNYIGLIKTSSATHKITDSAAGSTAFACGKKTYNHAIGVSTDSSKLKNITEILGMEHFKTGLIATSSITHATPATFYAHCLSRYQEELIASQLPGSYIDFFAGGGLQFFNKRTDKANYLDTLLNSGFVVDSVELANLKPQQGKKYGFLFTQEDMPTMLKGRGDFLPKATQMAINYLSQSEKGFFLMVEGSQIDWAGHDNEAEYLVAEMIDFDNTIGVAMDFAEKNENTLVIVLADHETGGFTLSSGNQNEGTDKYKIIRPTFSTKEHSATLIPVLAFGPGAENFTGIYENTEIFYRILKTLEIKLK